MPQGAQFFTRASRTGPAARRFETRAGTTTGPSRDPSDDVIVRSRAAVYLISVTIVLTDAVTPPATSTLTM
jgi:hypothetical protein